MFSRITRQSRRLTAYKFNSRRAFISSSAGGVYFSGTFTGFVLGGTVAVAVGWGITELSDYWNSIWKREQWEKKTPTSWENLANVNVDEDKNGDFKMAVSLKGLGTVSHINIKSHYNVTASEENEIKEQLKSRDKKWFKYPINGHIFRTGEEYREYTHSLYCGDGSRVIQDILYSVGWLPLKYEFAVRAYRGIMENGKLARKYRGKWVYVDPILNSTGIVTEIDVHIFASEKDLMENFPDHRHHSYQGRGYYNCMGLEFLPERR